MKKYSSYEEFDDDTGFTDKAGFTLAEKQIESTELCSTWQRLGNFSEVGCGKTVMATVTSYLKGVQTSLITVPPILIPQWQAWLLRFTPAVIRYQGTPQYRAGLRLDSSVRWIVMSHAILRQDFKYLYNTLNQSNLEIIVDEAQSIKNSGSVLYKCVTKLGAGKDIQLLTGTPTNKPMDAYAYIKIKTPEVYRSLGHFENIHVEERDFFRQPTKYAHLDFLAKNLALQTVRHNKKELFGYNLDPIYTPIPYDLDPDHLKLYEKLVDEQLLLLDNGSKIDATTAQRLYHALQQIVCNWSHFAGDGNKRSAIYDLLDQTIEETDCLNPSKSKLIVWTYYKMTSRAVTSYLNQKWPHTTVAAYSEADSANSVSRFMAYDTCRILVAQPSSAGVGLNPAPICSEALFIECSTQPMQVRQAIGRLDRMGQKVRPTIRFAQATGTIQGYLYSRLSNNDDLVLKVEDLKESLRRVLKGVSV